MFTGVETRFQKSRPCSWPHLDAIVYFAQEMHRNQYERFLHRFVPYCQQDITVSAHHDVQ